MVGSPPLKMISPAPPSSAASMRARTAADWMNADVKAYQTMVALEGSVPGLKPGMSAEVTIIVQDALQNVLMAPLTAIVGSAEMGEHRSCFVLNKKGEPEEREITVGLSNEKMVEIKAGVEEGDQVVVNPKVLVGDKRKTREPGAEKGAAGATGQKTDAGKTEDAGKGKADGKTGSGPGKEGGPGAGKADPAGGKAGAGKAGGGMGGAGKAGGGKADGDKMAKAMAEWQKLTPEEQQKRMAEMKKKQQALLDRYRKAKKEDRKAMLEKEQIPPEARNFVTDPEAYRQRLKDTLEQQGIEFPDEK